MLRFRSFSAEYAIDWITRCNHFDLLTGRDDTIIAVSFVEE